MEKRCFELEIGLLKYFFRLVKIELSNQIVIDNLKIIRRKEKVFVLCNWYLRYLKKGNVYKYALSNYILNLKLEKKTLFLLFLKNQKIMFDIYDLKKYLFSLHNLFFSFVMLKGIGLKIFVEKEGLNLHLGKSHVIKKKFPVSLGGKIEGFYNNKLILWSKFQLKLLNFSKYIYKLKKKNKYTKKGFYLFENKSDFYL